MSPVDTTLWVIAGIILLFGFVVFFGPPYVPSRREHIMRLFDELYKLKKSDVVLDLGSGDGVVLREISKRGARAVGFELNPALILLANFISRSDQRVHSQLANIWTTPFPDDTTVLYVFTESRDVRRMIRRIQSETNRLNRQLTVLSYGFAFPDTELVRENTLHKLYVFQPLQKE